MKAKGTVLANACERTPVSGEVKAAVENEADEEGKCKGDSDDNKDERCLLETAPDEDTAVEEEEGKLGKA